MSTSDKIQTIFEMLNDYFSKREFHDLAILTVNDLLEYL